MSKKHQVVSIGPPNEMAQVGARMVQVRDEFGLSLDPKEHADLKCRDCWGRGTIQVGVRGNARQIDVRRCGCSTRGYHRRRSVMEVAKAREAAKVASDGAFDAAKACQISVSSSE